MIDFNQKTDNTLKGLLAITVYFIFTFLGQLPLNLLNIDYNSLSVFSKELYNFTLQIIMLTTLILIFKKQLQKAIIDIKTNHMNYFSKYFKYYILGLLLMLSSNIIIQVLGGQISGNETEIRNQFEIAPIYTYISAAFLAPFLEELIFRLAFRNLFTNNIIFIIISGLIFGSLHLINGISIEFLPLYLISYSSFGFIFAYIFTKTNNIFVSTGYHTLHNGILMSIQLIILIFG